MRFSFFLYFILSAFPLASQSPLSAIDWLSSENNKFQKSILDVKKIDSENTNDIQVSTLSTNEYQSIGLLPIYVTGIPTTIWRNSNYEDLEY